MNRVRLRFLLVKKHESYAVEVFYSLKNMNRVRLTFSTR
jgi:hypothetical protein